MCSDTYERSYVHCAGADVEHHLPRSLTASVFVHHAKCAGTRELPGNEYVLLAKRHAGPDCREYCSASIHARNQHRKRGLADVHPNTLRHRLKRMGIVRPSAR